MFGFVFGFVSCHILFACGSCLFSVWLGFCVHQFSSVQFLVSSNHLPQPLVSRWGISHLVLLIQYASFILFLGEKNTYINVVQQSNDNDLRFVKGISWARRV